MRGSFPRRSRLDPRPVRACAIFFERGSMISGISLGMFANVNRRRARRRAGTIPVCAACAWLSAVFGPDTGFANVLCRKFGVPHICTRLCANVTCCSAFCGANANTSDALIFAFAAIARSARYLTQAKECDYIPIPAGGQGERVGRGEFVRNLIERSFVDLFD